MKRIYEAAAYGPQGACFWADTVPPGSWPALLAAWELHGELRPRR